MNYKAIRLVFAFLQVQNILLLTGILVLAASATAPLWWHIISPDRSVSLVRTTMIEEQVGAVTPPPPVKPTIPKPARVVAKNLILGMPLSKVLKALGKPDAEYYCPVPPNPNRSEVLIHAGGFVKYYCADGVLYVEFDCRDKVILVSGNGFHFGEGSL